MVVLASLMVVGAFHLFMGGLSALAYGPARLAGPMDSASVDASSEEAALTRALQKALVLAFQRIDPLMVQSYAVAQLVVGALLLLAVAAIVTNDRRGRRSTLVAAWVGIAYNVATALFYAVVVRGRVLEATADWMRDVQGLRDAGFAKGTPEEVLRWVGQVMLVVPVGFHLACVGFCVVVIAYFGGRRGRDFYGLPSRGVPEAGRGG